MEQISRRHHFNPKFLLKGFTPSGKRNDLIWEFDGDLFTKRRGTPKTVAWEIDYYAIDREGERPDAVETMMGEIESTAAPIVSAIIEAHKMPRGRDFAHFLIFLALMYMRGPAWRDTLTSFHDQVRDLEFRLAASSEERWALVSKSKQWADRPERHLSFGEARRLRDPNQMMSQSAYSGPVHTEQIVSALSWLPELLMKRHWGLVLAAPSAPDLITGDSPTSIQWTDPQMEGYGGAGLGYRGTEVAIALHRRLAVIGRLEHVEPLQEADLITIANINGRTAGNASRYVYAASGDFVFMSRSGEILSADTWFHSRAHLSRL